MKKFILSLLFLLPLLAAIDATACVGKVLYIGVSNTPQEQLLAEMVSILVTERTGTTVKILTYKSSAEIYNAVKQGQVGLIIEDTDHALEMISRPKSSSAESAYELVKKEYRKNLNLVWLSPFGAISGATHALGPVIAADTLSNLPALPKLINKLSGVMNDSNYPRLLKALKSEKPGKIARDFLKARKYI